jgi:hypothetical protein
LMAVCVVLVPSGVFGLIACLLQEGLRAAGARVYTSLVPLPALISPRGQLTEVILCSHEQLQVVLSACCLYFVGCSTGETNRRQLQPYSISSPT